MTRSKLALQIESLSSDSDSEKSSSDSGSNDSNITDCDISFIDEFHKLAKLRHWKVGSKTWKKNWEFFTQLENERLRHNSAAGLKAWQQLCEKLGLEPLPSIIKCRKALSRVYVNMVDVFECWATDKQPKKFQNAKQLAAYTKDSGKFFNRDLARKSKVLRVLLKRLV